MQIADLDPNKDNEIWSAKIDGAHTIIKMEEGKLPLHFSHRISKKTNEPIEYTAKLQHIKTPSKFNAVIRGETYATTKNGKAVHPDVVTALLNSGLEKSLALQKNLGITTQTALIDVDKFNGKDMRKASYAEKRAVLEEIAKSNSDYHLPDTAYDAKSKAKLLKSIVGKTHHQTKEGIVVHDKNNPDRPFTKAKVIDHHDVYITGIFVEEGVKEGRKPMAGGFTYAWSPSGKTVGKVGTGFNHKEKVDMMKNPNDYIGRVAKVKALDVSKNKVLIKPSFDGWHVEKNLKEASELNASNFIDTEFEKLAGFAPPMASAVNRTMSGLTTKRVMSASAVKPKNILSPTMSKTMKKIASTAWKKFLKGSSLKDISARAKGIDAQKVVGKAIPGVEYNLDAIAKGKARGDVAKMKEKIISNL